MRILLVEDDNLIAEALESALLREGFQLSWARDGEMAIDLFVPGFFGLVLLDVGLPGMDGFSVFREIRKEDHNVPIVFLTSRSDEIDRVVGLELGADDYVTKPFSFRELLARIRTILRRTKKAMAPAEGTGKTESIEIGGLQINCYEHKVYLNGISLDLTQREYLLLELLAKHPDRAFSRDELFDLIWDYKIADVESSINSLMFRLRKKIEVDPKSPRYLVTVRGHGYRLVDPYSKQE